MIRNKAQFVFSSNPFSEIKSFGQVLESIAPAIIKRDNGLTLKDNVAVTIQGVSVPLSTPINWVLDHMAHPDHFLYLVIKS